ncbi:MAG: Stp1/IreP family PP2C-type Ser/Thr phosphatase [Dethiobacter sp.]|jgi:protein phosphatase|nr:Stp1/IreP family PP2C-type Ser/Thr phosphatase [Dethiobacter sp.]
MDAAGISDRGKVREKNEDSYLLCNDGAFRLYAVADGMGGHAAGEVASNLALECVRRHVAEHGAKLLEDAGMSVPDFIKTMLDYANLSVLDVGLSERSQAGMGTTLTMLFGFYGRYWLGHIGDSRAYLINNDGIFHLTEDHTLVTQLVRNGQLSEEETNCHPQRHILTRALGTDKSVDFDIMPLACRPGDTVLLCSDGLHSLVDNEEIHAVAVAGEDIRSILEKLVSLANERGGTDNITAVLVQL